MVIRVMKGSLLSLFVAMALALAFAIVPALAYADEPTPAYQTLDELSGKRFAYVNGSVYNQGIHSIQEETGLALGYTRWQVFSKIVFPQARHQFAPQLMGQFISLVKDTAVVGYIAVCDLTRASDLIRARTMDAFFPLVSTAIIYFLFCLLLSWVLHRITDRLDIAKRPRTIEGVDER